MTTRAGLVDATMLAVLALVGCSPAPRGVAPACSRGAEVGGASRCGCAPGRALLLGACLDPPVADLVCGPAARFEGGRCAFRKCPPRALLDADGACVDVGAVERGGPCAEGQSLVVDEARASCVPVVVACPRGSLAAPGGCQPRPSCPAGALASGDGCRAVVFSGPAGPVVDLGVWALLVLGATGGPGSIDLCRPVAMRPSLLGVAPGERRTLELGIHLAVPAGDVSRAYADVHAVEKSRDLPPAAQAAAAAAVSSLVEALRGLGGQASTTAVDLALTCEIAAGASG